MAVSLGRKRSQSEVFSPRELGIHPQFQGEICTKRAAVESLSSREQGSYVLWTKKNTHYLSFVTQGGEIQHKPVTKDLSTWSWQNGDPHCKSTLRATVKDILGHESSPDHVVPQMNSL